MSDEPWERATRRSRWPPALAIAVAVLAAGVLARPDTRGTATGTLAVVPAPATVDPTAGAAAAPRPTASVPEAAGEWAELDAAPIDVPPVHVGVWTGTEFVVGFHLEVAAYDPAAGTWRRLPDVPGPERVAPRAVWTGRDVVVFGGTAWDGEQPAHADGLRLDPATGQWREIPVAPSAPLFEPVVVWTGEEVVVWGGARPGDAHELGAWPVRGSAYDPATDRWRVIAEGPVEHVYFTDGVWTGRELVVWGSHHPPGVELRTEAGVGFTAAYQPATDSWRRLPGPPLEDPAQAAAVWTGRELLLWGRPDARSDHPGTAGAALAPAAADEGWRMLPGVGSGGEPEASVHGLASAWTPHGAMFYGGYPRSVGLVHEPRRATWQRLPPHRARVHAAGAWTGTEFLLWGGYTTTGPDVDLWAFRPPAR